MKYKHCISTALVGNNLNMRAYLKAPSKNGKRPGGSTEERLMERYTEKMMGEQSNL